MRCRIKANSQLEGPEPVGGVSLVGWWVYLRNPSSYVPEHRSKPPIGKSKIHYWCMD